MKKIIAVIIIASGVIGGYAWYSPYMTLEDIQKGFYERDAEKVIDHVDFDAVRESIKVQFTNKIMQDINKNKNGFEAMGAMFGAKMVDSMIDTYITPSAFRNLMKDGKINKDRMAQASYDGHYINYNKYEVIVSQKGEVADNFTIMMKRDGLAGWKVYDIQLPTGLLNGKFPSDERDSPSDNLAQLSDLEDDKALRGQELYALYQCSACHSIDTDATLVGPSLKGIGAKRDTAYLKDAITNPDKDVPEGFYPGIMPPLDLPAEDLDAIIKYLNNPDVNSDSLAQNISVDTIKA